MVARIWFEGIDVRLQTKVAGAGPHADGVRLDLVDQDGTRSHLDVDHVIAATGYRVDVHSLGLLSGEFAGSLATVEGSPRLMGGFESSVPGLFFSGQAAAATFGPMLRFVCGSGFAGPRVADGVTARLRGDQERDRSALSRDRTEAASCFTIMVRKGRRSSGLNQASLRRVGAPGISGAAAPHGSTGAPPGPGSPP